MVSRIIKNPLPIPSGVEVKIDMRTIAFKGAKGELSHRIHPFVQVIHEDNALTVSAKSRVDMSRSMLKKKKGLDALAGTTGALLKNCMRGVTEGFSKKLTLVGVGYRAQSKGKTLVLELGFSHPVEYALPDGVTATVPSATEIELIGADKQKVGQVAAEIRAFRPPEPYKGKGVRYSDEQVKLKETKKK